MECERSQLDRQGTPHDRLTLFRRRRAQTPLLDLRSQLFGSVDEVTDVVRLADAVEAAEGQVDGMSGSLDGWVARADRQRPRVGRRSSGSLLGHARSTTEADRS
jgi:hypothetical protein